MKDAKKVELKGIDIIFSLVDLSSLSLSRLFKFESLLSLSLLLSLLFLLSKFESLLLLSLLLNTLL
jgi:hypothetical protein